MANFGVRAGYVWRGQRNQYGALQHQPAVLRRSPCRSSVRDPGPDGTRRQRPTMAAPIAAFDLAPEYRGAADRSTGRSTSTTATRDYHTFEITGTKRMSNRWSLLASYGWTKSFEQRRHRSRATRSAPTRCRRPRTTRSTPTMAGRCSRARTSSWPARGTRRGGASRSRR